MSEDFVELALNELEQKELQEKIISEIKDNQYENYFKNTEKISPNPKYIKDLKDYKDINKVIGRVYCDKKGVIKYVEIYKNTKFELMGISPYITFIHLYDEKFRGNSSSQISTYEGLNNSLYEHQTPYKYGFPLKSNHQIQNKIYQKINKRLKERQYEKGKQKLEEFSKLIHLDDAILSDDFSKDKFNNSNSSRLANIEKNKLMSRPLSSYQLKKGRNSIKNQNNNIIKKGKPLTPKLLKCSRGKNNIKHTLNKILKPIVLYNQR